MCSEAGRNANPLMQPKILYKSLQELTTTLKSLGPTKHADPGYHLQTIPFCQFAARAECLDASTVDTLQLLLSIDGAKVSDNRNGVFARIKVLNNLLGEERRLNNYQNEASIIPISVFYGDNEKHEVMCTVPNTPNWLWGNHNSLRQAARAPASGSQSR